MASPNFNTPARQPYYEATTIRSPQVVRVFPATEISQQELVELIEARNVLAQLKEQVATLESGLLSRLEAGAFVQVGVHVAELKEGSRRSVAWRDITLRLAAKLYSPKRAEAYCENVLQNTKPTRTVSLDVS